MVQGLADPTPEGKTVHLMQQSKAPKRLRLVDSFGEEKPQFPFSWNFGGLQNSPAGPLPKTHSELLGPIGEWGTTKDIFEVKKIRAAIISI